MISLDSNVKITQQQVDTMGDDLQTSSNGFIDFFLLDDKGLAMCQPVGKTVIPRASDASRHRLMVRPCTVLRCRKTIRKGFEVLCQGFAPRQPTASIGNDIESRTRRPCRDGSQNGLSTM